MRSIFCDQILLLHSIFHENLKKLRVQTQIYQIDDCIIDATDNARRDLAVSSYLKPVPFPWNWAFFLPFLSITAHTRTEGSPVSPTRAVSVAPMVPVCGGGEGKRQITAGCEGVVVFAAHTLLPVKRLTEALWQYPR